MHTVKGLCQFHITCKQWFSVFCPLFCKKVQGRDMSTVDPPAINPIGSLLHPLNKTGLMQIGGNL